MQIRSQAKQKAKPTLNPVLRDFWLTPARNRVLYGGRASSKSWDAAGFAIFLARKYKLRFMCVRQFQNKIEDSVYTLLKDQIERFGLTHEFRVLKNKIVHKSTGTEFLFYGLWRHITEIKSTEGVDVCWIEEAHGLTEAQWEILEPTLRTEASQFWIIFNPQLVSDFVYKKFVRGTPNTRIKGEIYGVVGDTIKRKINWTENRFLSSTILKVIFKKKAKDPDGYRHVYLGEPLTDDDKVIIKRSWIMAAIDAHKTLGVEDAARLGSRRVGFDVADDGKDLNAMVMTEGVVTTFVDEWKGKEDELKKSAGRVWNHAKLYGAEIDYDSIGVGAFAGSEFKSLNEEHSAKVKYYRFNAGGEVLNKKLRIDPDDPKSPLNEEYYSNVKAQAWWEVARRFMLTFNAVEKGHGIMMDDLIAIDSGCDYLEQLVDELSTPFRDFDKRGLVKVESKEDLKAREVPSPNLADGFIMANGPRKRVIPTRSAPVER